MDCNRGQPRYLWGEPQVHVVLAMMVMRVTFFVGAMIMPMIVVVILCPLS